MTKKEMLYKNIEEILWKNWNPIGIDNSEDYDEEYKNYAHHIFKLKNDGADKHKISKYLYDLETINIGLAGNKNRCDEIAQIILNL